MPIDWDEVRRQRAQQSPREAIAPPAIDWNEVRQARKLTQPSKFRHAVGVIPRGLATGVTEAVKGIGRLGEMGYIGQMGVIQPLYTATINKLLGVPTPEQFGGRQIVKAGGFATKQVERALPLRDIKDPYARFFGTTLPIGAGRLGGIIAASALTGGLGAPAWIGGAALGGFSQASEEYDKALKATGDPNKAAMAYFPNLLIGSIDAVPVGLMFNRLNRLSGGSANKIVAKWATGRVAGIIARAGKRAPRFTAGGLGAIEELTQEVIQETMTNMTARQIYDESRTLFEGTAEVGAAGVILGFFANAIGVHVRMRSNQPDISTEEQQLYEDASENIEQAKGNIAEQMADRARPKDMPDEQWATLRPKFIDELAERIETGRWLEPETTTENAQDVAARMVIQEVMEGTLKSENPDVQEVLDKTRREHVTPRDPTKTQAETVITELRAKSISEIEAGTYEPVGESQAVTKAAERIVKHIKLTNKQAELQEQLATLEQPPETPMVEQEVVGVAKEADEIPVGEEFKGEIAQIHKQLSVISQSILSKQRLRSNTKKLITDIDKKVNQELEAQGLTPTEVKPPGQRTQQAVARELKQAQEDVLAALGRNKDGTIKARQGSFEGKQIFLKGNWFTVVDKVARQRYIREGNTAKEADEAATRRWEVPPEEMGIIHKLLTGYNRVDKKTRRKMDNAVGFAFDNKYDLEQIKIMAQMGFPSKPVDPDTLNEILSEAFGYKPGDTTDTIRTKMENLIADKTKEGRRKRRQFGDFLDKLITSGMDQQLRKMGPEGTQLADGITNLMSDVRGMIGDWSTKWKRMLVKSQLSESQFDDWVSFHEGVDERNKPFTIDSLKNETGKIKYSDDILNRMATLSQEFKALTDDIHKAATDAKIDVEYLENYWPRIFKWQEMSDSPIESTRTGYIRSIAERHGVTETEAQNLYEKYYKNRREFYAPNLEEERVVDMGGYVRTPDAVSEFINNAAQKIAEMQVFGKKYEKAIGDDGLISRIPDEQDSATAQQIFDRQFRREVGKGDTHALKAFEWMQNLGTIRLVFSAIPNSTQTLMAGFRTTFFDFATQTAKLGFGGKTFGMRSGKKRTEMIARAEEIGAVMDKTNRDFWASEFLGVKKDNPILDWTGFTATEKYNAILASNMGMSYADRLLSKLSKVKPGKGRYQSKELYDLLYSPTDIEQYGRDVHEVLKEYAQTHKGKIKLDELMENKTKLHKEADLKALLDNGEITQEQFDKFSEITIGDVATKGRMRAGLRVLDDSQMIVTGRFKLPYYWNSPAGKWFTQFKSFSYRSSQLFYRELKRKGFLRFMQSFLPYIALSYLPHFGIARLRELIYGGNFDGDTWDLIEPIFAAGIGAIPMQFIMAATYGKFAESLVPPGADVLVAPVVKTIEAVSGRATPSVMIEEFLRSAGALPPPLRVPFAIAGPIAAGVARRMRREKPTAISIRRRPTR